MTGSCGLSFNRDLGPRMLGSEAGQGHSSFLVPSRPGIATGWIILLVFVPRMAFPSDRGGVSSLYKDSTCLHAQAQHDFDVCLFDFPSFPSVNVFFPHLCRN